MGYRLTLLAHGTEMKLQRENITSKNANTACAGTTIIFNFTRSQLH